MHPPFLKTVIAIQLLVPLTIRSQTWHSQIVNYDTNGRLVYFADAENNRVPDFSYAGYKNSDTGIPDVPVVLTISAIAGDNTAHLQQAIDQVAAFEPDGNGFRGALLLEAGEYGMSGTLRLDASGVVLRGVGDGEDPATNTILRATGNWPPQRTVLIAGGGSETKWPGMVPGTKTDIVSDFVPVGARTFEVADAAPFAVGDNMIIYHPCTEAWLAAIDFGGTHSNETGAEPSVDVPWEVDSQPLVFNRNIEEISGNAITIDAPVFNHLDRSLAQSYIYKYDRAGLVTNVGVENLRIDIETTGGEDENHAWNGIDLFLTEDAWVRNCTILHFGLSAIRTNTATRVTIENVRALDPVARITGGNMYNFQAYTASQQILFRNCHARNGRHHYMSNGTSWTSGIVFLDCTSEGAYAASEGHRRWSMGLLYDNHRELDGPRPGVNKRLLGLYNRGYFGTSHGWAAAHSVAWNCDVAGGELHVQKPPTAQNYAIGCTGIVTGKRPPNSFDHPEGYIEGTNQPGLEPRSLFAAQLFERTATVVGVSESERQPVAFWLEQNYPNPFNPVTRIQYVVFSNQWVSLKVYDLTGREVATLVEAQQPAGAHSLLFDARHLASGVYVYRLVAGDFSEARKMVVVR